MPVWCEARNASTDGTVGSCCFTVAYVDATEAVVTGTPVMTEYDVLI